jgi:hypothetical protein
MLIKNFTFVFSVLIICSQCSGVYAQDLEELEKRYGFKDLRLESSVGDYKKLESVKHKKAKIEGISSFQAVKGSYLSIGKIKIHKVKVLAYDSMIYEISVITEKNPDLYKGLEKAFGKPQITVGYGAYTWKTENLSLTFRSHSKSKLELRYHAYAFEQWLKEEKQEKIQDVSSDF